VLLRIGVTLIKSSYNIVLIPRRRAIRGATMCADIKWYYCHLRDIAAVEAARK
jgi:hypothetical protein